MRAAWWMAVLTLAACGAGSGGLEGRWHKPDEVVEFRRGGRMALARAGGRVEGRYDRVGPRRVQVTFDGTAEPLADWRFQVRGDSLVLCETDRPGDCARYVRAAPGAPPPFAASSRAGSSTRQ